MFSLERDKDTIAAVSTAPGLGGVAIVRVSGPRALECVRKRASFLPEHPESHRIYYGILRDNSALDVDEVLVSYFSSGKSFTGEQTVEISCHGSPVLTHKILRLLIESGVRLADRGEFTYRAFMNGRIDLVQAESVLQLIESQTEEGARLALRQLKGGLSEVIGRIEDDLVWIQAHLEANIDFAQEDIEVAGLEQLRQKLSAVIDRVEKLISSYRSGKALHEGARVGLVGLPNVGKSSLLNSLVREEKAIVTDIPGTTRDLIEAVCVHDGVRLVFIDTAGLRDSEDRIEQIGIERTKSALEGMDFVLLVSDSEHEAIDPIPEVDKIIVRNKSDLWSNPTDSSPSGEFIVSAKTGRGLEDLKGYIVERIRERLNDLSASVSNARHFELLKKILESLHRAMGLLDSDASPEFIAFELQESLLAVHELLGKQFDDQVMDRVFHEFCLGK